MGRVEQYRAELRKRSEWEAYLKKNSGLPGPRANLELVEAVGERRTTGFGNQLKDLGHG